MDHIPAQSGQRCDCPWCAYERQKDQAVERLEVAEKHDWLESDPFHWEESPTYPLTPSSPSPPLSDFSKMMITAIIIGIIMTILVFFLWIMLAAMAANHNPGFYEYACEAKAANMFTSGYMNASSHPMPVIGKTNEMCFAIRECASDRQNWEIHFIQISLQPKEGNS